MTDVLTPVGILGTFGLSIYFFTKVLTDYLLRKRMVDKGYVNEDSQSIFKQVKDDSRLSSLKWGLLVLSGGIALVIIDALQIEPDSTLPYGIFAICVSLGFLTYYFFVKGQAK